MISNLVRIVFNFSAVKSSFWKYSNASGSFTSMMATLHIPFKLASGPRISCDVLYMKLSSSSLTRLSASLAPWSSIVLASTILSRLRFSEVSCLFWSSMISFACDNSRLTLFFTRLLLYRTNTMRPARTAMTATAILNRRLWTSACSFEAMVARFSRSSYFVWTRARFLITWSLRMLSFNLMYLSW